MLILKSKKKVLMQELILNWAGENASETKEMKSFLLVLTKKTRKPKEIMQASPDFTDLKKVLFCPRARHFDSWKQMRFVIEWWENMQEFTKKDGFGNQNPHMKYFENFTCLNKTCFFAWSSSNFCFLSHENSKVPKIFSSVILKFNDVFYWS